MRVCVYLCVCVMTPSMNLLCIRVEVCVISEFVSVHV